MAILTITKDNFSKEVMESVQPVLLDFWANWCGPCRMLSPIIDEIGEETAGIKVGKVNVDEQRELAAQFGVMSIPTLVVIKNGKAVKRSVGVQTKDVYKRQRWMMNSQKMFPSLTPSLSCVRTNAKSWKKRRSCAQRISAKTS